MEIPDSRLRVYDTVMTTLAGWMDGGGRIECDWIGIRIDGGRWMDGTGSRRGARNNF